MLPLRALRRFGSALSSAHRFATETASRCSRSVNHSSASSWFIRQSLSGARGRDLGPSWSGAMRPSLVDVTGACFSEQRRCYTSVVSENASNEAGSKKETISVTFVDKDGDEKAIHVPVGMSMLDAAHENDIELEGACEGSLACSTCHVIVTDEKFYQKLSEPTDEENDMLDLAFGLTQTSRLGCQVVAQPELDGMKLSLPSATRNFAVDGFVPKPH